MTKSARSVRALVCGLMLLGSTFWTCRDAAAGPSTGTSPFTDVVLETLEKGRHPELRWPNIADVRDDVLDLYIRTGGPVWLDRGRPAGPAWALIARLLWLADLGLDPSDYDAGLLERRAGELATADPGREPADLARFDLALSVGAARVIRALQFGRVSPHQAHARLEIARAPFDVTAAIMALSQTDRPDSLLEAVQPHFRHYWLLRRALLGYRRLARDSTLLPLPPPPRGLELGSGYDGSARLRRLLRVLGDLPDTAAAPAGPDTLYDSTMVRAVMRFQRREGLKADGRLVGHTWARLNRPFGERVRQIELTLERWRWLPREFGAPPIFVNLPEFRLHAFASSADDEAGILTLDVVIGKAYRHGTPVFADTLESIVFRPYWEVPRSIAWREVRPKALRDPGFVDRGGFDLLEAAGEEWHRVPATADNVRRIGREVRVRQRPGPDNALGAVKFLLPNPFNIYLHDTPARELFAEPRRDFSHGCIRVADAGRLAAFVLRDQPPWTPERIAAAMEAGPPTPVPLERPVPIFIVYATALALESGEVRFFDDVYGLDRELNRLLRRGYPYER